MSLLSWIELTKLVHDGVIQNLDSIEQVNSTSIDIRLGDAVLIETQIRPHVGHYEVSLKDRQHLLTEKMYISKDRGYLLKPGEFILAQSMETFHLPNDISAEYKLKSSMARIGLEHLNAGWCDSGWSGSVLTLELKNMTRSHCIRIRPGDFIGQMVFFRHVPVPADRSYAARGRYNNDTEVTGVKL